MHAPGFVALQAGVRRIAGLFVEHIDADQAARRLKRSGLDPGAGQLALHAPRASVGYNLERVGHREVNLCGCDNGEGSPRWGLRESLDLG